MNEKSKNYENLGTNKKIYQMSDAEFLQYVRDIRTEKIKPLNLKTKVTVRDDRPIRFK